MLSEKCRCQFPHILEVKDHNRDIIISAMSAIDLQILRLDSCYRRNLRDYLYLRLYPCYINNFHVFLHYRGQVLFDSKNIATQKNGKSRKNFA